MEIRVSDSVQTIFITRNLKAALDNIAASPDRPQRIWVDAICINQFDPAERTAQVAQMRDIYSLASQVIVFLAPSSEEYEIGLRFLEQAAANPEAHYEPSLEPVLTVLNPKDELTPLNSYSESLRTSMVAFFAAPWWTRVWTVQEYVLAKHVVFQCGQRLIQNDIVTNAFEAFRDHERQCCWAARVRRLSDTEAPSFIDEPNAAHGGLSLYHATMRLDRLRTVVDGVTGYHGLLGALMLFRTRQCSDPRDQIFGFMGFRFDDKDVSHGIQFDYLSPAAQLYEKTTISMIEASRDLNVLSHVAGLRGELRDLPSWVPDWTAPIDEAYHFLYTSRVSLLHLYSAAGDSEPDWRLMAPGTISTKALILGSIEKNGQGYPVKDSIVVGQELLDEWKRVINNDSIHVHDGDFTQEQQDLEFAMLITGSLLPDSEWQDNTKLLGAYESWRKWFSHPYPLSLPQNVRRDAREFDTQVQIATASRCVIRTEEGLVGFGPEGSEQGDVVALFPGGKMVYVLRRVGVSDERYKLVGDCYLHNAMMGEKATPTDGADWKNVTLV